MSYASLKPFQLTLQEFLLDPNNVKKQNELMRTSRAVYLEAWVQTEEPKTTDNLLLVIHNMLEPLIINLSLDSEKKQLLDNYITLLTTFVEFEPGMTDEEHSHLSTTRAYAFHVMNVLYCYEENKAALIASEKVPTPIKNDTYTATPAINPAPPKQRNRAPKGIKIDPSLKTALHQLNANACSYEKHNPTLALILQKTHQTLAKLTTQHFSLLIAQQIATQSDFEKKITQHCRATEKKLDNHIATHKILLNIKAAAAGLLVFYFLYLLLTVPTRSSILLNPPNHSTMQASITTSKQILNTFFKPPVTPQNGKENMPPMILGRVIN